MKLIRLHKPFFKIYYIRNMKTFLQKTAATTAVSAILLGSIASAYAMSDTEFQNKLLKQIQIEEDLSDAELLEFTEQIQDISREDILASLQDEIEELEDDTIKTAAQAEFDILKAIQEGEAFFHALDEIYDMLDSYYEENEEFFDDDFDWEYDFEEEKQYILESLEEEKKYLEDQDMITQVNEYIEKLKVESEEDNFFDMLDEMYEKIDAYYGIDFDYEDEDYDWDEEDFDWEYDFEDIRNEILEELKDEREYIKDNVLKAKFETTLKLLEKENDEDAFFEILDEFYSDETLENYYESIGIDLITGDEFLDGEYDFESEKPEILEELLEEIAELDDSNLESELQEIYKKIEALDNEDDFFDTLHEMYEKLDMHYGEYEEYEFDFAEERKFILEAVAEEIEYIDNEELQSELKKALEKLSAESDEDAFFEMLDAMYEKADAYYEASGNDFDDWDEEDEFDWEYDDEDFDWNEEDFDDWDELEDEE